MKKSIPVIMSILLAFNVLFGLGTAAFAEGEGDAELLKTLLEEDDYTAVIPYSTGNEQGKYYGVDNENPLVMASRAYLDQTGAGASYYEVIYDRTIVFHKK